MTSYILLGMTFAFAAGVQPGPLQSYLIAQTIEKGWRRTLPASFSPMISDGPILLLVLSILSAVPDSFIIFLRIAGGLFLLYLSMNAFKSWQQYNPDTVIESDSGQKTLMSAVVVNILNPNPYLGWSLVMGPLFLEAWDKSAGAGIAMLIAFYSTLVVTLAGTIILFGFARKLGPKVNKILLGISALALFIFGIYQLWAGVSLLMMSVRSILSPINLSFSIECLIHSRTLLCGL